MIYFPILSYTGDQAVVSNGNARLVKTGGRVSQATRPTANTKVLLLSLISIVLSGCADRAAPSLSIVGAYFPGWMICALLGIVTTVVVRVVFIISGLAEVLPYQLFVCTAIGGCAALLAWLLWFGQ